MSVEGDDFVENAVRAVEMRTTNIFVHVSLHIGAKNDRKQFPRGGVQLT